MNNDQRTEDEKMEARNTEFFAKHYLNKIGANYKIIHNKEQQVLGDDLELYGKTLSAVVDIKAKTYNYTKFDDILSAGCGLELSRICKDGIRREGWFIDKKNITDLYCFLLPVEKNFEVKEQVAIFVSKNAVKNAVLQELAWDNVCELSSFNPERPRKGMSLTDSFYVTKSFEYRTSSGKIKMQEEPVNLCLKINHLCKLAKRVIRITPDKIEYL